MVVEIFAIWPRSLVLPRDFRFVGKSVNKILQYDTPIHRVGQCKRVDSGSPETRLEGRMKLDPYVNL